MKTLEEIAREERIAYRERRRAVGKAAAKARQQQRAWLRKRALADKFLGKPECEVR